MVSKAKQVIFVIEKTEILPLLNKMVAFDKNSYFFKTDFRMANAGLDTVPVVLRSIPVHQI